MLAPLCPTSRIVHVLAKWVIFVTRGDVKQSAIEGKQDPPTTTTQDNKNNDNNREGAVIGSHVGGEKKGGGRLVRPTKNKGEASASRQCEGEKTLPSTTRKIKGGKKSPTIGATGGEGKSTCKVPGTEEEKVVSNIGVVAEKKNINCTEVRHTRDSSLLETPVAMAAATTKNAGGVVSNSGTAHCQKRGKMEPVVGNSFPQENPGGVKSTTIDRSCPRIDYRIATATTLNSVDTTSTAKISDGVHSESITGHREEEVSSGENRVFTARSDAGGDALLVLGEAAVLPIANMNEAGFHVADGFWKGETEEEIWRGNEFTARPDT